MDIHSFFHNGIRSICVESEVEGLDLGPIVLPRSTYCPKTGIYKETCILFGIKQNT